MGLFSDGAKAVATVAVGAAKTAGAVVGVACDMAKPIMIGTAETACKVAEVTSAVAEPVIKTTVKVATSTLNK